MKKLYFKYGAMNCGKTTHLLQTAHNYEEQGLQILILKPDLDKKGEDCVISRLGVARKVDRLVHAQENLLNWYAARTKVDCLLVDEVQFFTPKQIEELYHIAVLLDTPVICYGLRSDFLNKGFPASSRLMELAHSLMEFKTVCSCGNKATCNLRLIQGEPSWQGEQVAIDQMDSVSYRSVCSACYEKLIHSSKKEQEERG